MAGEFDSYWRSSLKPSPDQAEVLTKYLDRSTLFWNFCVDHLSPAAEIYMNADGVMTPPAQWIQERATALMDMARALARNEVLTPEDNARLIKEWVKYIPRMFDLPETMLLNRLSDLVGSYMSVKTGGRDMPTGMPRRKTEVSSQSIRIEQEDFSIDGNKLSLKTPYPVTFCIPDLVNLKTTGAHSLSITRRATTTTGKLGPAVKATRMQYTLTLRPS